MMLTRFDDIGLTSIIRAVKATGHQSFPTHSKKLLFKEIQHRRVSIHCAGQVHLWLGGDNLPFPWLR